MIRRPARVALIAGFSLILLLIAGRGAIGLYTDALWFDQLGYGFVLWRQVGAVAGLRVVTGLLGAVIVLLNLGRVVRHLGPVQLRRRYGNLEIAEQVPHAYVTLGIVVASALAGWWLSGLVFPREYAPEVLAWLNRGTWGARDPLFNRDLGFFVFTLPVIGRLLDFLLLVTVWSAVLALVGYVLVGAVRLRSGRVEIENHPKLHFAVLVAALIALFAARYWLARYGLLLEGQGFGGAVGYTDVHARLPAYRILFIVSVLGAGALIWSAWTRNWLPAIIGVGLLLLAGVGLGIAYPSLIQKLRVVPNELARESEYIGWNLEYTRRAWDLDRLTRTTYPVEPGRVPDAAEVQPVLDRLPLWDPEPIQTNFVQVQSGRAHYHFPGVHYDRYGPPGSETQIAIAVREFTVEGLQQDRRTWRTLHVEAEMVRGNGAVAMPVAEKTSDGSPLFWLLGTVPPDEAPGEQRRPDAPLPSLTLERPSVFFTETPLDYLLLNPTDSTSDVAIAAERGGIPVGSFFRVFAFTWRFGDRNLLFSPERRAGTRLLYRRGVHERLRVLAPFIHWDNRPHPVIADGRVVWTVDGYTYSRTYPIARPFPVTGFGPIATVRYLRNSVKATVDGLTGEVTLYAVDLREPILAAWSRAFPGMFRPLDEMEPTVRRHLRYPLLLVEAQANVLEAYHVESPEVFFAGQNEWQIPQEPAAVGGGRDYAPVYMMARAPGATLPSFLLVTPFIARDRQNMTAILIVENDPGRYGEKTLLELPRTQQVSGPRQVRTIIEQDPAISQQLSLWRTGGSQVEIGRMRVIPLDRSILYVQPIFLSGSGGSGASIPQLQRVIVSDGTSVAMAETLEAAVAMLLGTVDTPEPYAEDAPAGDTAAWASRALELMDLAERALRDFDWTEFGRRWSELQDMLRRAGRRQ